MMPNYDKSGPEGMGSRTGRGLGQCRKEAPQGLPDENRSVKEGAPVFGQGRGLGRGRGCGRGGGRGRGGRGRR